MLLLLRLVRGRRAIAHPFRPRSATITSDLSSSPRHATIVSSSPSSPLTALFRRYDFDEIDIDIITCKFPGILAFDLDNDVRPKLGFLRDCGLTGREMGDILASNPFLLKESLGSISSSVNFLKTFFPSKESLELVLGSPMLLRVWKGNTNTEFLKQNVEFLKERGFRESHILACFAKDPRVLQQNHSLFVDAVCRVEGLGISSAGSYAYVRAMKLPADSLRRSVEFARKIGWKAETLIFAQLDLEKCVIPRCAVLNLLVSRGLLRRKNIFCSRILRLSQRLFFERYVEGYRNEVPEVENAFRGDVKFQGLEHLKVVDGGTHDSDDDEEHPLSLLWRKVSQAENSEKDNSTHP